MIRSIALAAAILGLAAAAPALAADVGVSVSISQPGVYGRVDIGRFPQPAVIVPRPVVIHPVVVPQPVQPVYMWVPDGHRRHWGKHCGRYHACGVPVYFVQDRWYHDHVGPPRGHGHKHGHKGKGRGHDD